MPYVERTGMISQRHPFYGYGAAPTSTPRSTARTMLRAATGLGDETAAASAASPTLALSPALGAFSVGMGALQLFALHYVWKAIPQKRWPFWIAALGLGGLGMSNVLVGTVTLARSL